MKSHIANALSRLLLMLAFDKRRGYSGIFKTLGILVFLMGFFAGTASAAPRFSSPTASESTSPANVSGHWFAGYIANQSNRGAKANITYANPYVINDPTTISAEWVMSTPGDGTGLYVQMGWLKFGNDPGPQYFGEYGCPGTGNVCRKTDQSYVASGTTHEYRVNLGNANATWYGRVDGVEYAEAPVSLVGFTQTSQVQYFGETLNTGDNVGGTPSNPVSLNNVTYSSAPGVWNVVNVLNLIQGTSPACYFAEKGTGGGITNIANWTDRSAGTCP